MNNRNNKTLHFFDIKQLEKLLDSDMHCALELYEELKVCVAQTPFMDLYFHCVIAELHKRTNKIDLLPSLYADNIKRFNLILENDQFINAEDCKIIEEEEVMSCVSHLSALSLFELQLDVAMISNDVYDQESASCKVSVMMVVSSIKESVYSSLNNDYKVWKGAVESNQLDIVKQQATNFVRKYLNILNESKIYFDDRCKLINSNFLNLIMKYFMDVYVDTVNILIDKKRKEEDIRIILDLVSVGYLSDSEDNLKKILKAHVEFSIYIADKLYLKNVIRSLDTVSGLGQNVKDGIISKCHLTAICMGLHLPVITYLDLWEKNINNQNDFSGLMEFVITNILKKSFEDKKYQNVLDAHAEILDVIMLMDKWVGKLNDPEHKAIKGKLDLYQALSVKMNQGAAKIIAPVVAPSKVVEISSNDCIEKFNLLVQKLSLIDNDANKKIILCKQYINNYLPEIDKNIHDEVNGDKLFIIKCKIHKDLAKYYVELNGDDVGEVIATIVDKMASFEAFNAKQHYSKAIQLKTVVELQCLNINDVNTILIYRDKISLVLDHFVKGVSVVGVNPIDIRNNIIECILGCFVTDIYLSEEDIFDKIDKASFTMDYMRLHSIFVREKTKLFSDGMICKSHSISFLFSVVSQAFKDLELSDIDSMKSGFISFINDLLLPYDKVTAISNISKEILNKFDEYILYHKDICDVLGIFESRFVNHNCSKDELIELANDMATKLSKFQCYSGEGKTFQLYLTFIQILKSLMIVDRVNHVKYQDLLIKCSQVQVKKYPKLLFNQSVNQIISSCGIKTYELVPYLQEYRAKLATLVRSNRKIDYRNICNALIECINCLNQQLEIDNIVIFDYEMNKSLEVNLTLVVVNSMHYLVSNNAIVVSSYYSAILRELIESSGVIQKHPSLHDNVIKLLYNYQLNALFELINDDLSIELVGDESLFACKKYIEVANKGKIHDARLVSVYEKLINIYRDHSENDKALGLCKEACAIFPGDIPLLRLHLEIHYQIIDRYIKNNRSKLDYVTDVLIPVLNQYDKKDGVGSNKCEKLPVFSGDELIEPGLYEKLIFSHKSLVEALESFVSFINKVHSSVNIYKSDKTHIDEFSKIDLKSLSHVGKKRLVSLRSQLDKAHNACQRIINQYQNEPFSSAHDKIVELFEQYEACSKKYKLIEASYRKATNQVRLVRANDAVIMTTERLVKALKTEQEANQYLYSTRDDSLSTMNKVQAILNIQDQHLDRLHTCLDSEIHASRDFTLAIEDVCRLKHKVNDKLQEELQATDLLNKKLLELANIDLQIEQASLALQTIKAVPGDFIGHDGQQLISMQALVIVSNLTSELTSKGAKLKLYGSTFIKMAIAKYNSDSSKACLLNSDDIDSFIPYDKDVDVNAIVDVLIRHGFVKNDTSNNDHFYSQYSLCFDNINIDLTIHRHPEYRFNEFLPIRMGDAECVNPNAIDLSSDLNHYLRVGPYYFKINIKAGFEDVFVKACQFKEFIVSRPHPKFRAYCYNIYKYLDKLKSVYPNACNNFKLTLSDSFVSYANLMPVLTQYFIKQLQSPTNKCYLEMYEFIRKGLINENKKMAVPFIEAFFIALLTTQISKLQCVLDLEHIQYLSAKCANYFIDTYVISVDKIDLGSIKQVMDGILNADAEVCQYYASLSSYSRLRSGPNVEINARSVVYIQQNNYYAANLQSTFFANQGCVNIPQSQHSLYQQGYHSDASINLYVESRQARTHRKRQGSNYKRTPSKSSNQSYSSTEGSGNASCWRKKDEHANNDRSQYESSNNSSKM